MSLLSRTFFYLLINIIVLLLLNYLVSGFFLDIQPINLVTAALIFTFLNNYIRPFARYVFTTFIIITFGLFSLLINAGILLVLDFLSDSITINGLTSLIYSTLIIAAANVAVGILTKLFFRKNA